MTFLTPWAFAWLGLSVPVVALYFLKMKRRRVQVPSTWLWRKSIDDLRVNAPFQRLRANLLLLLQLLLIAAGALALARPTGKAAPPEHKRWVLLIDRSASMSMKDVEPSRLAEAKKLAKRVVEEGGPDDEFMVVAFAARAQVLTPLTGDRGAVGRAIEAVEPSESQTRAQEAYRLAASALEGAPKREIVVLSDGAFEAIVGAEDIPLRYLKVGGKPRNAAITAVDVRKPLKADDPWTIFAQVDLFHGDAVEIPLELHVNGQLKSVRNLKVAPPAGAGTIFEVDKPVPEIVELRLGWPDDLAVDDRAWFVVRQERTKLLLAGSGNFFLERAVAQVRDAEAFRAEDLSKSSLGEFSVAILDGVVPEPLPEGRYLIFGAVPKWEGVQAGADVATPAVVDWNRRHPVLRHLDPSELTVKAAPKLTLPGYAAPLIEGSETPLAFAWEKGRTRAVVVPFRLQDSDWPLRLSFPLFISNAIEWLRDEGKQMPRPGEPLRIRLGDDESEAEVSAPGGQKRTLKGEKGGELVYGETERAGVYAVKTSKDLRFTALNLADPNESSGRVADELRLGKDRVAKAAVPEAPATPYWRWFAAGVVILLLLEWLVYHRRL
jgi:hypothetical protein